MRQGCFIKIASMGEWFGLWELGRFLLFGFEGWIGAFGEERKRVVFSG